MNSYCCLPLAPFGDDEWKKNGMRTLKMDLDKILAISYCTVFIPQQEVYCSVRKDNVLGWLHVTVILLKLIFLVTPCLRRQSSTYPLNKNGDWNNFFILKKLVIGTISLSIQYITMRVVLCDEIILEFSKRLM